MELYRHASAEQAARVVHVFVEKQVEETGGYEGRWKIGQGVSPSRRCILRNPVYAGFMPEKGGPAKLIARGSPNELTGVGVRILAGAGAIIQHRIDQMLKS